MNNDFAQKLAFSMGNREKIDMDMIRNAIPGCVSVKKTTPDMDRNGIDYIATLRGGAVVYIDAKTREKGASKYWKNQKAELALEIYSVIPDGHQPGKVGWTLNEGCGVDMILYTFDIADHDKFYILPFQHLRAAFVRNYATWKTMYVVKEQSSNGGQWKSKAMFVPASVVINGVMAEMVRTIPNTG